MLSLSVWSLSLPLKVIILLILQCYLCRKGQDNISSNTSKSTTKSNDSNNYSSIPLQRSSVPSNNDDDDFDPRGLSSNSKYSMCWLCCLLLSFN